MMIRQNASTEMDDEEDDTIVTEENKEGGDTTKSRIRDEELASLNLGQPPAFLENPRGILMIRLKQVQFGGASSQAAS